jgi:tetratricopeptide (TPR) repeat protein
MSPSEQERKLAAAQRGHASVAAGDLDGAIAAFNEALALDPGDINLVFTRGLAFYKKKRYGDAIVDFTAVIDHMPSWPSGFVHRGEAHLAMREFDRAIADFSESIHLSPSLGPLYHNRALAYEAKGDLALANVDFAEAARLSR